MNILLIDDDPFALALLRAQLQTLPLAERGYGDIESYQRARDAMPALEHRCADFGLVVCDLHMPEMDGVEVVRQLVHIGYTGGLVLISGQDRRVRQAAERLARAHRLNILGSIEKPFAPRELDQYLSPHRPAVTQQRSADSLYLPVEVERAIRNSELANYYQPKVDLRTGSLAGLEALVRWRHPTDGVLPPHRFLPVAEDHGMTSELTDAVLRSAVTEMARWAAAGLHVNVAVNVSMGDLNDVAFPDTLARLAAEFDVPMAGLSLEVTEGQLMTEPRSQLDVLTRLRLKGVRLSIDDFGVGYSCMAQLRDLPFDELKVDRSFVDGASRDPSLKAILDASLGLARQMGMSSVGEGVETVDDWHCLRRAGCNVAQGYLIARPMPAEHVDAWTRDWATRFASLDAADAPAPGETP